MGQSAQTMHMLTKPQVFYDNNLKQALGFQNPFYLKKAQQIRPMLYDGNVIAKETNVISIADSEETLMLKEESRSKMILKQCHLMVLEKKVNTKPINYAELNQLSEDFGTRFVPRRELSDEQASHPITDQYASSHVKIKAPRNFLRSFKRDVNTSVKVNSSVIMNDSVNYVEMCNECLELEAELIKTTQHVELQAKDTTIKKLKSHIKRVNETFTSECVKKDFDEIETINIELEHRKIKGKDIVANAAQISNAATIAPGMYKLDLVILASKVKNNREAHEYYLKHTMEQAATLREVVEQTKSRNPLDSASYSACMYVKLIQDLLGYVRDTCPDIHKPSKKLVAVTPINKKKTVRFVDIVTSSGNIPKVTNRPLLFSTGVNPSTSASGSKPSGNTKNDRISQTPSSNERYKVEVQSKKVKSKLNKQNSDSKHVCNEHVNQLIKGAKALCSVCNECLFDANHAMCLVDHVNSMNVRDKFASKKNKKRKEWQPTGKVFNYVGYKWKPTGRTFTLVRNACPLTRITVTNKVPLRVTIPLEVVAPEHVVTRVYTRRPKVPKSVQNSKPKGAKSMTANRMEPSTSWGSDTLVAPSSSSLIDCRDIMVSSPICLLSKATKTKSWLWHRRLSHLNFGAINHLARHSLVRGLPRLKFKKDHLCSACSMGKSKKQSYKPKSEDTNQEKLYLLHMDLCGPLHITSVNGKKYILIIVDDYSRFTWVKFLASKDEAPDFIIKFLKMIQVRLNATVRNIRIDNGTEFVNQTLRDYYEQVGISHETLVAITPQQNGVVE
ncbi:retrovirus-related pol polyprotein from transposon TNT 1-94, partial [Tanacetum coccineum]